MLFYPVTGALRYVPIPLRETEEIMEMYHQYVEANSLISMWGSFLCAGFCDPLMKLWQCE